MSKLEEYLKIFTKNEKISEEEKQAIYDYVLLKKDDFPRLSSNIYLYFSDKYAEEYIYDLKNAKSNERESYNRLLILQCNNTSYAFNIKSVIMYYSLDNSIKTAFIQFLKDYEKDAFYSLAGIYFFLELLNFYNHCYRASNYKLARNFDNLFNLDDINKSCDLFFDEIIKKSTEELIEEYQGNTVYIPLYFLAQLVIHKKDKILALKLIDIIDKIETREDIIIRNILLSLAFSLDVCDDIKNKFFELLNKYEGEANYLIKDIICIYKKGNVFKYVLDESYDNSGNHFLDTKDGMTYKYLNMYPQNIIDLFKFISSYPLISSMHYNQRGYEYKIDTIEKLYEKDKEKFYSIYKLLQKAKIMHYNNDSRNHEYVRDTIYFYNNNANIYLLMTALLLKNKDEKLIDKNKGDEFIKFIIKFFNPEPKIFKEVDEYRYNFESSNIYEHHLYLLSLMYDFNENAKNFIDNHFNIFMTINSFAFARNYLYSQKLLDTVKEILSINKNIVILDIYNVYFIYSKYNKLSLFTINNMTDIVNNYLDDIYNIIDDKKTLTKMAKDIHFTSVFLNSIYAENSKIEKYDCLFYLLESSKSKEIKNVCTKILEKLENKIRSLVEEKVKDARGEYKSILKNIIKNWDLSRFDEKFEFSSIDEINNYVDKYYNEPYEEKIKKYNFIEEEISNVLLKDKKTNAPLKVMKYIFLEYIALKDACKLIDIEKIVNFLDIDSFRIALNNIYKNLESINKPMELKNIYLLYCLFMDIDSVLKLRKELDNLAENSRGALAAYIVQCIALNGSKSSLIMVDNISIKFKNNQVKTAAKNALANTANILNIPQDELVDKIVPNFNFDKKGKKILSYGGESNREFTISIEKDFSLSIFDNQNKKIIKSLPSPNSKDDKDTAYKSKKELTELKKSIKTAVQSQKIRLKKVLLNGRKWSLKLFKEVFIENPIMNIFAQQLIWGIYDDNNLIDSFRYTEDGTFNTFDDEEYKLNTEDVNKKNITLVNPMELDEEILNKWINQLSDYEIVQPIEQLNMPYELPKQKDINENFEVISYAKMVNTYGLMKFASDLDMKRGAVLDAGSYTNYYLIDETLKIACMINFDCLIVGYIDSEEVEFESVTFYKLDEDMQFDEDEPNNPLELNKRFVASICGLVKEFVG